jgi:hypothetical protein
MALILVSFAMRAGACPRVLPEIPAALTGRSPPVLELKDALAGASINGEVVPRRSRAAGATTATCILLIQAAGTLLRLGPSTLSASPTLDAKRDEERSNPRMINQSNLGGVSGRQPSTLALLIGLT